MKTENTIAEKSYAFSLRIIDVYKKIMKEKHQFVIGNQLLRSGTSIGANVEEILKILTSILKLTKSSQSFLIIH